MSGLQIGTAIGMFTDAMAAHSRQPMDGVWVAVKCRSVISSKQATARKELVEYLRAKRASMSGLQIGTAIGMFTMQWQRTAANALGLQIGTATRMFTDAMAAHSRQRIGLGLR
jgi:antitoxin component of RelBE/YafQ-DinJ toxin-antitoxin module